MENSATETGFVWECDGNLFEEENVLEDSLPEGFKYKINKFKIIEKSEIKEEIKFQAEFVVNICDKEEATRFINSIQTCKPLPFEFNCTWPHVCVISGCN